MPKRWSPQTFNRFVELVYRATTDAPVWTEALGMVGESLPAAPVAIHVHGMDLQDATTIGIWGRPAPVHLKHYERYYAARNVWLLRGARLLKAGAVLTGEEMCSDEELLRSEYYNDFLRPLGIRYSLRAVLTSEPEPLSYLSAGRPHEAKRFSEADKEFLGNLVPHLMQAVRIQERLETVQSRRRIVSGALERMGLGVFFLDNRGRVVELNPTARKIVEAKDGLTLDRRTLVALDAKAETSLQKMILGASGAELGGLVRPGGSLMLPREAGKRPLSLMVAPTGVTGLFPASRAASVVVLVEEPTRAPTAPLDAFTISYGLSRAEAALTSRLIAGFSVAQAASALGIQPSTARSQLKKVFVKTGARRQSDLVRRVLTYDPGQGGES